MIIKGFRMNELTVVDKATEWRRMKGLVLDSVRSPITKRVYNMALNEFFDCQSHGKRLESDPGRTRAGVVVDHREDVGDPQAGGGSDG